MGSNARGPKLGDLVTLVRGTTYKGSLLGQPGPVLLGLASIQRNGGFRGDSLKTYGGECKARIVLRPGDMYVSLKDVTQSADLLGAVARLPDNVVAGRLTQDTVKLEFVETSYPRGLVYWALRTPSYRSYCREYATGTTTLGLAREDFLAFGLPPVTDESLLLVDLLEALESRIQRLAEANTTLEAIAQALFKSWFVDFDPVHAKAEGREPEAMDAATATLFPSEFEESELGPIPRGWCVGCVGDLLTLQRGFDLPVSQRIDGEFAILAASGPSGYHLEAKVSGPGVTTGRSGILGRVFYVADDFWPLNTSLWIKEFKIVTAEYAYQFLKTMDLARLNAGSAVPTLNRNHVHGVPCVVPDVSTVEAYTSIAAPLLKRIHLAEEHALRLSELRDTLLPRLISGKLRLTVAAEAVEAALA